MTLAEIRERPTTLETVANRYHESIFRSYMMLQKVRSLLMADPPCPPKVLLEMIDDVMDAPHVDQRVGESP